MRPTSLSVLSSAMILTGFLALGYGAGHGTRLASPDAHAAPGYTTTRANELIRRQPGFFIANLGQ